MCVHILHFMDRGTGLGAVLQLASVHSTGCAGEHLTDSSMWRSTSFPAFCRVLCCVDCAVYSTNCLLMNSGCFQSCCYKWSYREQPCAYAVWCFCQSVFGTDYQKYGIIGTNGKFIFLTDSAKHLSFKHLVQMLCKVSSSRWENLFLYLVARVTKFFCFSPIFTWEIVSHKFSLNLPSQEQV